MSCAAPPFLAEDPLTMKLPRWLRPPPEPDPLDKLAEATAYLTDLLAKYLDAIDLAVRPVDSADEARKDLAQASRLLQQVVQAPGASSLLMPAAAMMQSMLMAFEAGGIPTEQWMAELRKMGARGIDGAEAAWKDAHEHH